MEYYAQGRGCTGDCDSGVFGRVSGIRNVTGVPGGKTTFVFLPTWARLVQTNSLAPLADHLLPSLTDQSFVSRPNRQHRRISIRFSFPDGSP